MIAIDSDPELVRALAARARERSLPVTALALDARGLELGRRFALALAPMQVVQLLGGAAGRARMLARVRRHLLPGGLLAAALADPFEGFDAGRALPPLPDVREENGWVLSSTPVAVRVEHGATAIDRHRQAVSPSGELIEEVATIRLDPLDADTLEAEGSAAGLRALRRRSVPETPHHVSSTVVILEAPA
jgi:hypothetical protein